MFLTGAPHHQSASNLLGGEPRRHGKNRVESSWILSTLCTCTLLLWKGLVIGVAMTTHAFQLLCVCGWCTSTPPPLHHLLIKKKKINPVSGDHALALAIGWIISKQRTRSFETWEGGTCCLQQLALSIEKWSPIVSQMTNLPSGTWLYCLGQTLPWLSLSSLFFTRPLH